VPLESNPIAQLVLGLFLIFFPLIILGWLFVIISISSHAQTRTKNADLPDLKTWLKSTAREVAYYLSIPAPVQEESERELLQKDLSFLSEQIEHLTQHANPSQVSCPEQKEPPPVVIQPGGPDQLF
jgi:hypothetical protein